jgi:hypothetical protein
MYNDAAAQEGGGQLWNNKWHLPTGMYIEQTWSVSHMDFCCWHHVADDPKVSTTSSFFFLFLVYTLLDWSSSSTKTRPFFLKKIGILTTGQRNQKKRRQKPRTNEPFQS